MTANRLALLLIVAAAAVFIVWRFVLPAEKRASDAVADEAVTLLSRPADARLTVAKFNLEQWRRTYGSYAGAPLPAGAVLARADANGYCVQVGPPGPVQHLAGPGGAPAPGAC
jgi:hypothetical protein